jgi:hypothetical protein
MQVACQLRAVRGNPSLHPIAWRCGIFRRLLVDFAK